MPNDDRIQARQCVWQVSEKMECPFLCKPRKFGWWSKTRLGKHSHYVQSYRQGGQFSEKWLPCHIANVGSKGGCHSWNSVDNCSKQITLSESMCALLFEATHWPAKGTEHVHHTSTSILVSWRPCFPRVSAGKVLLTVFFDTQGPLFVQFLEQRRTITSDVYCETLQSQHRFIKNKRPDLLIKNVVLFHINTHSHSVTHSKLIKFNWEQLGHPPYSSDILLCDFHLFGPLKKHLKELCFNLDDELKDAVKDWVSSWPQKFWEHRILRVINQWDHCA